MKYIKLFEENISKIEELSDYLQEFFDDNNIIETKDMSQYSKVWWIKNDAIFIFINKGLNFNTRREQYNKIIMDIRAIVPLLESRLNVDSYNNMYYYTIDILNVDPIQIKVYQLNRSWGITSLTAA